MLFENIGLLLLNFVAVVVWHRLAVDGVSDEMA